MRCGCDARQFVVGVVLTASIRRQDDLKEKMRRKKDSQDSKELFGGTGDMQKRRFARIEIQWKDWTTTGGVVW